MPLVAHVSDIHLLSLQGAHPGDFLGKRVTGVVNLLLNRGGNFPPEVARALVADINAQAPDHVLVTGDVSNLSLPAEFRLVDEVLQGLDLPPRRVTVIPGNHDCYTGHAHREELFEQGLSHFLRGDVQPGPGTFPFLRLQDGLAVVAASSAHVSAPLLAVGSLGGRQLRLLEGLLNHRACQGRFRVLALHHPPYLRGVHWHNRLTDHAQLGAMLRRAGADLVVHGHIHRHQLGELPGPGRGIPVVSAASGTWLSPGSVHRRAQYNLYEIQGLALKSVTLRRLDLQSGAFEEFTPIAKR